MNPYDILNINPNCTKEELRKAYLKLVLKHHPDRSNDPNAEEKIKEIYTAYQLLKNDEYRIKFDSMENNSKFEYYNEFKKYFNKKYPSLSKIIENIIQIFYEDEEQFKNDFNNFDFEKIYNTVTNKIPNIMENFEVPIKINTNNINKPHELNIYGTVYSNLKNRYLNKYEKISVNRITKDPKIFFIPLRENRITFQKEGELYKNNEGDIIIDIIIQNDEKFSAIGNNLYTQTFITLYEYLFGGEIKFVHIDDENISLKFDSLINNIPFITVPQKGLPFINEDNEQIRGDLIIEFKIKDLNNLSEKIKNIYD